MYFGDNFSSIAVQVRGLACSLGLLFQFFVTFIGRRFVMDGVGFFFVDGLFFHGAGCGKDGCFFLAQGTPGSIGWLGGGGGSVLFFAAGFFFLLLNFLFR